MSSLRASFITTLILAVTVLSTCQNPSSTNDKEGENQDLPGLTHNFSYNTEVGNYKTHVFDGIKVSDGIVIVGSYLENSSGCGEKLFLLKLDNSGNEMWLNKFNNIDDVSGCEGGNIMQTLDGGFLIAAVAQVDVPDNHYDHYLFKFDASGALSWSKELDYKDFDFIMKGFQQANGNFILYNQLAEGSATSPHNRITMSDNGTIITEESHSDFTGDLIYPYGLIRSSTENILYLSSDESGTHIQVSDKNLNKIANANFPDDEFYFMNQAVGSQEGYYALDEGGNFAKFDNQFNPDWNYIPPEGGKAYYKNMPVELSNAHYAVLEKGVPQDNGEETIALSIIEEGGNAIARELMNGGESITIRKVIADSNDNVIVISWSEGLLVNRMQPETSFF